MTEKICETLQVTAINAIAVLVHQLQDAFPGAVHGSTPSVWQVTTFSRYSKGFITWLAIR
jgi:hypothetical protein